MQRCHFTKKQVPARGDLGVNGLPVLGKGDLLGQELLDDGGDLLVPQLLEGLEHVGGTLDGANLTSGDVAHVNTLSDVEGDGTTALNDVDSDRWDVISGTIDHPAVTGLALLLAIDKGVASAKEEGLLSVQNVHVLDARLETLSRLEEERELALAELPLTKLGLASLGIERIDNDAVLAGAEGRDGNLANDTLIDVGDVGVLVGEGNQPLLTSLAEASEVVSEAGNSLELEGLLLGEDVGGDSLADLLVDVGEVGTLLADEPLLASRASLTIRGGGLRGNIKRMVAFEDSSKSAHRGEP